MWTELLELPPMWISRCGGGADACYFQLQRLCQVLVLPTGLRKEQLEGGVDVFSDVSETGEAGASVTPDGR